MLMDSAIGSAKQMSASLIGRSCQGSRSFVVHVKGFVVVWVTLLYAVGRDRSGALQAWVGMGRRASLMVALEAQQTFAASS